MADIFISYSHRDGEYAHRLAEEFRSQGLDVWIDDRIDYGDQWPRIIQENLAAARVFIVIMSTPAYNSMWVQNEVSYAQANNKPMFPMLLEGRVWLSLAAMQYADVREGVMPPAKFVNRLRRALDQPILPEPKLEAKPVTKTSPRRTGLWVGLTGFIFLLALATCLTFALRGQLPFLTAPTPTQEMNEPTVFPTEPPATEVPATEAPPTDEPPTKEPTPTEEPPTEPPPTEVPFSTEFTSMDFHLAVGDVRTYKFGLATEDPGSAVITQEMGEVVERVLAREDDSNPFMEIFRVERSGDMVALDCGGEAVEGQIKTIWYIRDATRLFTACSEEQRKLILDALVREQLFGPTPEPATSTPSYVFPVVVNAKWSRWADIPPDEGVRYFWVVDSRIEQKTTFAGTFKNCYEVFLRTNPDVTIHTICQGMGMIGWYYSHFGTLKNYAGQLSSYRFSP